MQPPRIARHLPVEPQPHRQYRARDWLSTKRRQRSGRDGRYRSLLGSVSEGASFDRAEKGGVAIKNRHLVLQDWIVAIALTIRAP